MSSSILNKGVIGGVAAVGVLAIFLNTGSHDKKAVGTHINVNKADNTLPMVDTSSGLPSSKSVVDQSSPTVEANDSIAQEPNFAGHIDFSGEVQTTENHEPSRITTGNNMVGSPLDTSTFKPLDGVAGQGVHAFGDVPDPNALPPGEPADPTTLPPGVPPNPDLVPDGIKINPK